MVGRRIMNWNELGKEEYWPNRGTNKVFSWRFRRNLRTGTPVENREKDVRITSNVLKSTSLCRRKLNNKMLQNAFFFVPQAGRRQLRPIILMKKDFRKNRY